MPRLSSIRAASVMTCALAALLLVTSRLIAGPMLGAPPKPPGPTTNAAEVVACAEGRNRYNQTAFPGYSASLTSTRQGYTFEGRLEEDYRIHKTIKVSAKGREETFLRGEKNGVSADVGDFWLEKLGMSKKYTAEAMNIFAAGQAAKYDFALRGIEPIDGRPTWKLAFKVKKGGEQELQKGIVWIDQATCGVARAEGTFPKVWVVEDVKAQIALSEVRPGLWLPKRQQVDLIVQTPVMKRRARMIDELAGFQVTEAR